MRRPTCGVVALNEYCFLYKQRPLRAYRDKANTFQDLIEIAESNGILFIPQKTFNLWFTAPCIAKYGENHFILIHKIDKGEVFYSDYGIPCAKPLDDFLRDFKGEVLSEEKAPDSKVLSLQECVAIKGEFKFFKDFLSKVLPFTAAFIPGIGPMASAILSAAMYMGTETALGRKPSPLAALAYATGSGLGSMRYGPAFESARAAGATVPQAVWQGTKAMLGLPTTRTFTPSSVGGVDYIYQGGQQVALGPRGTTGYLPSGAEVTAGTQLPTFTPTGTTGLGLGEAISMAPGGISWGTSPATTILSTGTQPVTQTGTKGEILQTLGGKLLTAGMGEIFAPKMPPIPEYPIEKARQYVQRTMGESPLYRLGREKLAELMSGKPLTDEEIAIITAPLDRKLQEEIARIKNKYQLKHRLGSGEMEKEIAELERDYATNKALVVKAAMDDAKRLQASLLQTALGYDVDQIVNMMRLADRMGRGPELDYILRYGDIRGIQDLFSELASMLYEGERRYSYV